MNRYSPLHEDIDGVTCRYCFECFTSQDEVYNLCKCNGFLCKTCLESELVMLQNRPDHNELKCSVCNETFNISRQNSRINDCCNIFLHSMNRICITYDNPFYNTDVIFQVRTHFGRKCLCYLLTWVFMCLLLSTYFIYHYTNESIIKFASIYKTSGWIYIIDICYVFISYIFAWFTGAISYVFIIHQSYFNYPGLFMIIFLYLSKIVIVISYWYLHTFNFGDMLFYNIMTYLIMGYLLSLSLFLLFHLLIIYWTRVKNIIIGNNYYINKIGPIELNNFEFKNKLSYGDKIITSLNSRTFLQLSA